MHWAHLGLTFHCSNNSKIKHFSKNKTWKFLIVFKRRLFTKFTKANVGVTVGPPLSKKGIYIIKLHQCKKKSWKATKGLYVSASVREKVQKKQLAAAKLKGTKSTYKFCNFGKQWHPLALYALSREWNQLSNKKQCSLRITPVVKWRHSGVYWYCECK